MKEKNLKASGQKRGKKKKQTKKKNLIVKSHSKKKKKKKNLKDDRWHCKESEAGNNKKPKATLLARQIFFNTQENL